MAERKIQKDATGKGDDLEGEQGINEEELAKRRSLDEILIRVGGTLYALDQGTIEAFKSDFLTKLVDPETNFRKPGDGIYIVDACPENFSAFVHMIRFGSFPYPVEKEKESKMLQEAAFWGIEAKVQNVLSTMKNQAKVSRSVIKKLTYMSLSLESSKVHHNFREDDGRGRIYCAMCSNRDIDSRYSCGRHYTQCKQCNQEIMYQPNLGWCHKCRLCTRCQSGSCPADDPMSTRFGYSCTTPHKSTAQLEKELEECFVANTF